MRANFPCNYPTGRGNTGTVGESTSRSGQGLIVGQQVVAGAQIRCTFGDAPAVLAVVAEGPPVTVAGMPAATIMDFAPLDNIPTFGMCNTISNPAVAAETAAKLGVFTPAPCIPATIAPWAPGSPTVTINGMPALTSDDMCMCTWGGEISVEMPGQTTTTVAG